MRDSVPSTRYSSVCNVLRQWNILLIPTYRVYRLYDIFLKLSAFQLVIIEETAQHLVYVSAHKALLESGVIKVMIINSSLDKIAKWQGQCKFMSI